MLAPALAATLAGVAEAMAGATRPWWIIGSAALALHGVGPVTVADVDLLVDEADVAALLERIGVAPIEDAASARFRSAVFARWCAHPLPVEVMAGFQVATDTGWRRVEPASRVAIDGWFVPSRTELRAMLALFGRQKDRARAAMLA